MAATGLVCRCSMQCQRPSISARPAANGLAGRQTAFMGLSRGLPVRQTHRAPIMSMHSGDRRWTTNEACALCHYWRALSAPPPPSWHGDPVELGATREGGALTCCLPAEQPWCQRRVHDEKGHPSGVPRRGKGAHMLRYRCAACSAVLCYHYILWALSSALPGRVWPSRLHTVGSSGLQLDCGSPTGICSVQHWHARTNSSSQLLLLHRCRCSATARRCS